MTREEEFASLYRNGTVYRPLQEEHSILVEVGLGCGWHKCAFCDFTRDPFCWIPLEEVHHSVQTLARLQVPGNRVFLLGQNAMMRPARELLQIFAWIHHYMPQVQEIAMYARADDVLRKTPEELRALRDMGLCDLHIGVESGSDTVLLLANKGETVYDMLTAFQKLDAARIGYFVTSILGLGANTCGKPTPSRRPGSITASTPKTSGCWPSSCSPAPSSTARPARGSLNR